MIRFSNQIITLVPRANWVREIRRKNTKTIVSATECQLDKTSLYDIDQRISMPMKEVPLKQQLKHQQFNLS